MFALRLDEVIAPALRPLEEVRVDVVAGWEAQETEKALVAKAQSMADQMQLGVGADDLGLEAEAYDAVTRDTFIDGTPDRFLSEIFEMGDGEARVISGNDTVVIVVLKDVLPPDLEDDDLKATAERITDQLSAGIAQDVFAAFAQDLQQQAGLTLNQAAINAVLTQLP